MKEKLEDYALTEKIFYPPNKLSTMDAPSGYKANLGDVTYYSPWGDVAIFYKDSVFAKGLVPLGRVISDPIKISDIKDTEVKITLQD
jgi:hypothetical protein